MSLAPALLLFAASVVLTLAAAVLFADRLDHIGPRLGLPESFTGLLTAFAADGPEISSALIALAHGEHGVSLGIVLGSNVFNLAAMIGMSAILAGSVRVARRPLAVEASLVLLATVLAGAAICGVMTPIVALAGLAFATVPYLFLLPRGVHLPRSLPPPGRRAHSSLWAPLTHAIAAVALIVLGSAGMVGSALTIAHRVGLSPATVGVLVLATVTSLPNAFTAIRLGLEHRGAALVSESFNSNTINLGFGVLLPGVIIGLTGASSLVRFDLAWLGLMTVATIVMLGRRGGAGVKSGAGLVGLYLVFLVVHLSCS